MKQQKQEWELILERVREQDQAAVVQKQSKAENALVAARQLFLALREATFNLVWVGGNNTTSDVHAAISTLVEVGSE